MRFDRLHWNWIGESAVVKHLTSRMASRTIPLSFMSRQASSIGVDSFASCGQCFIRGMARDAMQGRNQARVSMHKSTHSDPSSFETSVGP